jgi:hypothetical protein
MELELLMRHTTLSCSSSEPCSISRPKPFAIELFPIFGFQRRRRGNLEILPLIKRVSPPRRALCSPWSMSTSTLCRPPSRASAGWCATSWRWPSCSSCPPTYGWRHPRLRRQLRHLPKRRHRSGRRPRQRWRRPRWCASRRKCDLRPTACLRTHHHAAWAKLCRTALVLSATLRRIHGHVRHASQEKRQQWIRRENTKDYEDWWGRYSNLAPRFFRLRGRDYWETAVPSQKWANKVPATLQRCPQRGIFLKFKKTVCFLKFHRPACGTRNPKPLAQSPKPLTRSRPTKHKAPRLWNKNYVHYGIGNCRLSSFVATSSII